MSNGKAISKRNQVKLNPDSNCNFKNRKRYRKKPLPFTRKRHSRDKELDLRQLFFYLGYTPKRKEILNRVMFFLTNNAYGYFKMSTIARLVGCSRTTVETVLRIMEEQGVVVQQRRFRHHKEINSIWHLADEYRDKGFLACLSYFLDSLKQFRAPFHASLFLILSMSVFDSKATASNDYRNFGYVYISKDNISIDSPAFAPPLPYGTPAESDFFIDGGGGEGSSKISLEEWGEIVGDVREHGGSPTSPTSFQVVGRYFEDPPHREGDSFEAQDTQPPTHQENNQQLKTLKEGVMFAPAIEHVQSLVLTDKGKAELSCFSREALERADKRLGDLLRSGKSLAPDEAWRYFCKVAQSHSKEHNLKVDVSIPSRLCSQLGIDFHQPNVTSLTTPPPTTGKGVGNEQSRTNSQTRFMLNRLRNTSFTLDDCEYIRKKIWFHRKAIKAAQNSEDATAAGCISAYKQFLDVWIEKAHELDIDIDEEAPKQVHELRSEALLRIEERRMSPEWQNLPAQYKEYLDIVALDILKQCEPDVAMPENLRQHKSDVSGVALAKSDSTTLYELRRTGNEPIMSQEEGEKEPNHDMFVFGSNDAPIGYEPDMEEGSDFMEGDTVWTAME